MVQYSKVSNIKKRRLRRRIFFLGLGCFLAASLTAPSQQQRQCGQAAPSGVFANDPQTPHKRPQTPSNSHKRAQTSRNGRKHPQTPAQIIFAAAWRRFRLLGARRRAAVQRTTPSRTFACGNADAAGQIACAATRTAPGGHRARKTAFSRGTRAGRAPGRSAQPKLALRRPTIIFCGCLWVLTPVATCLWVLVGV